MDKERLEAIKDLSKRQVDLERQLIEAKSRADEIQRRLDRLDKDIETLFNGGAIPYMQPMMTALDDYMDAFA